MNISMESFHKKSKGKKCRHEAGAAELYRRCYINVFSIVSTRYVALFYHCHIFESKYEESWNIIPLHVTANNDRGHIVSVCTSVRNVKCCLVMCYSMP